MIVVTSFLFLAWLLSWWFVGLEHIDREGREYHRLLNRELRFWMNFP